MSKYTPTTRTYGHGSITFTHYPSSQRIAVVQTGENAVMDTSDLYRFMEDAGLLTQVKAQVWDEGARWAAVECGVIDEDEPWLTPSDNPYREETE